MLIVIVLAIWIGCAFWCASIMEGKGRSRTDGIILGLLLGIIGVAICAAVSPQHKPQ